MILINFKNYKLGSEALHLVGKIEKHLPDAIVAVSPIDLHLISFYHSQMQVYSQHVDFLADDQNRGTGFLPIKALKTHNIKGSLLNHSEHPLTFSVIKRTVEKLKKEKLKVILCAANLADTKKFIALKPDAIAFEDKKLVASGKSITTYKGEDVQKFAELLRGTRITPLCGAGISTVEDVKAAYELGCKGVLIASAIVGVPIEQAEKLLEEISKIE
jgi:triosephosphate isomerase (TIM)